MPVISNIYRALTMCQVSSSIRHVQPHVRLTTNLCVCWILWEAHGAQLGDNAGEKLKRRIGQAVFRSHCHLTLTKGKGEATLWIRGDSLRPRCSLTKPWPSGTLEATFAHQRGLILGWNAYTQPPRSSVTSWGLSGKITTQLQNPRWLLKVLGAKALLRAEEQVPSCREIWANSQPPPWGRFYHDPRFSERKTKVM